MEHMKETLILDATRPEESEAAISHAAKILARGGLVAFPTETVYGLGGDARDDETVERIFTAKGRPGNNPLIIHCASLEDARFWAADWPDTAEKAGSVFWPGPLTIVVPASSKLSRRALAGGSTVGLRVPAHPAAIALLREAQIPVAAPSANRSTALSPTSAAAVEHSLGGRIDAILDGGSCPVGIESTVLDLSGPEPVILRPGMITREEIAPTLGRNVRLVQEPNLAPGEVLRSPGQLSRHYSPAVPLVLVEQAAHPRPGDFLICLADRFSQQERRIHLPRDPVSFAEKLYWALHVAETSGARRILMERPPSGSRWTAIHDRLQRAATHVSKPDSS